MKGACTVTGMKPAGGEDAGPRAILRVPDVLMAIAGSGAGIGMGELATALNLPKASLHRLLRTLEHGGRRFIARCLDAEHTHQLRDPPLRESDTRTCEGRTRTPGPSDVVSMSTRCGNESG